MVVSLPQTGYLCDLGDQGIQRPCGMAPAGSSVEHTTPGLGGARTGETVAGWGHRVVTVFTDTGPAILPPFVRSEISPRGGGGAGGGGPGAGAGGRAPGGGGP